MGERQIVLSRAGHYFTPNSSEGEEVAGGCQSATIAFVHNPDAETDGGTSVINIGVLDHSGRSSERTSVPVGPPVHGGASFHLNRDCPWGH